MNIRQSFPVIILPLLAGLSIHSYASSPVITSMPAGGGNVVIGACNSGIPDSGGIQSNIDACVASAGNHGKLVSCVTRYSKDLNARASSPRVTEKPSSAVLHTPALAKAISSIRANNFNLCQRRLTLSLHILQISGITAFLLRSAKNIQQLRHQCRVLHSVITAVNHPLYLGAFKH